MPTLLATLVPPPVGLLLGGDQALPLQGVEAALYQTDGHAQVSGEVGDDGALGVGGEGREDGEERGV